MHAEGIGRLVSLGEGVKRRQDLFRIKRMLLFHAPLDGAVIPATNYRRRIPAGDEWNSAFSSSCFRHAAPTRFRL